MVKQKIAHKGSANITTVNKQIPFFFLNIEV